MFTSLFRTPWTMSPALRDELHSLCHGQQIDRLSMPSALRRDIGLDCGCDTPQALTPVPPAF